MTDDLDDLKAALRRAVPTSNAAQKAAALDAAMQAFEKNAAQTQETAEVPRLTSVRPSRGFIAGVRNMLSQNLYRGVLAGTTALVAVALVMAPPTFRETAPPPGTLVGGLFSGQGSVAQPEPLAAIEAPQAEMSAADSRSAVNTGLLSAPAPASGPQAAPSPIFRSKSLPGNSGFDRIEDRPLPGLEQDTEAFSNADAAALKITQDDPVSTFSVDVDTASYSYVRSVLNMGQLPRPEAVRVEEMVNYFPYDYAAPTGDLPFATTVHVTDTPWNTGTQLVHIALQGAQITERPPLNLVFLIDTSGSMNTGNKLPLLKQAFRLMLGQLRPQDEVAIVAYAGSAGQVLAPTSAAQTQTILSALDALSAGGGTAGQAGLQQAYAIASSMMAEDEVARVVLATDGDFNVGLSDPDALKAYIAGKRDTGVYLNVLGFGRGNLDDATMQALAQNGNGQAAYIDTLTEARKVLVDQVSGALFPIASDVKVQVEFNPAAVAEYRLIGYETRSLKREDFNNDAVDAGDIGAGHQVTALYEVTPVGSSARLTDPLRYGAVEPSSAEGELGFLRLRYKAPGASESALIETPIAQETTGLSVEAQFGIAVAGFGQLLRGSTYLGAWSYGDAIALATDARGDDPFGYRQEAIGLMRLAEALSAKP